MKLICYSGYVIKPKVVRLSLSKPVYFEEPAFDKLRLTAH
jgi:hypothetical protein